MKQHTVPQNIMSVEFKIIGDLTVRQFIYISIAGGLAFIFYLTYIPSFIKYTLITISILLGILVTFAKINERPFDTWINSFITAVLLPTQRVWRRGLEIPEYLQEDFTKTVSPHEKVAAPSYKKIAPYINSRTLPTDEMYRSNTKLDIDEIKTLTNIDKLLQNKPKPTQPMLGTITANPSTPTAGTNNAVSQVPPSIPQQTITPTSVLPAQEPLESIPEVPEANTPSVQEPELQMPDLSNLVIPDGVPSAKEDPIPTNAINSVNPQFVQEEGITSNTFTIEPNSVLRLGDLEKLQASEIDDIDAELAKLSSDNIQKEPAEEAINYTNQEAVQPLNVEPTIAVPSVQTIAPDPVIAEKLAEMNRLLAENTLLKEELEKAHEQSEPMQEVPPQSVDDNSLYGHMPDFTKYPNIISGVVVDSNNKQLEDVVVIIKNQSKAIMRAMKTNIIGQFYSRNPLNNGSYIVEANKEGFVFESATITLTGAVVAPLVLRPKKFDNTIQSGVKFN